MKYIAIDTATAALSVAAFEGELNHPSLTPVASTLIKGTKKHGETLVPTVGLMMKTLEWAMQDLDGLIVGIGPGSFTGLRIGVTYAKTVGQFANIPVYTMSSLAAIATAAIDHTRTSLTEMSYIMPIIDARRNTAYTGLYAYYQDSDKLEQVVDEGHYDFIDWLQYIQTKVESLNQLILVGESIDTFIDLVHQEAPKIEVIPIQGWKSYPLMEQAVQYIQVDSVDDLSTLAPYYSQLTLAEREWQEREQIEEYIDHQNQYIDRY